MAWQTITTTDVKTRLAGAEVTALQESALAAGQTDPFPEIIDGAVDEVRGYIAASGRILEAGATIPSRLRDTTLALIRHRCATRLPGKTFLTDDRVREYQDAIRLLERVADGKFAVEEAVTADTEVSGAPSPSFADTTRSFTNTDEDGL